MQDDSLKRQLHMVTMMERWQPIADRNGDLSMLQRSMELTLTFLRYGSLVMDWRAS